MKRFPDSLAFDDAAQQRLVRYAQLLEEVAIPQGMVAKGDRKALFERHVVDSLRAATLFSQNDRASVDLGSGAGLPGIVLAAALPGCSFVLIESRSRRVGFLELCVAELGLPNVEVLHGRVEEVRLTADVVTARAFAPVGAAWDAAYPLLRSGGRLIYFAGQRLADPERLARSISSDRRPASVSRQGVLENATPLVIMARG